MGYFPVLKLVMFCIITNIAIYIHISALSLHALLPGSESYKLIGQQYKSVL